MTDEQVMVTWTPAMVERLRKEYNNAVENGHDQFVFELEDGRKLDLVTNYAKYLIQYLVSEFGTAAPKRKPTDTSADIGIQVGKESGE